MSEKPTITSPSAIEAAATKSRQLITTDDTHDGIYSPIGAELCEQRNKD